MREHLNMPDITDITDGPDTQVSNKFKKYYHSLASCGLYVGVLCILASFFYGLWEGFTLKGISLAVFLGGSGFICSSLALGSQHLQRQKEMYFNRLRQAKNNVETLTVFQKNLLDCLGLMHKGVHSVRDKTTTACLVEAQYVKGGASILEGDVLVGVLTHCARAFEKLTQAKVHTRVWMQSESGRTFAYLPEHASLNSPDGLRKMGLALDEYESQEDFALLGSQHPVKLAVRTPEVVIIEKEEIDKIKAFNDTELNTVMLVPFRMNRESEGELENSAQGILTIESPNNSVFDYALHGELGLFFGDYIGSLLQVSSFVRQVAPDHETVEAIENLVATINDQV